MWCVSVQLLGNIAEKRTFISFLSLQDGPYGPSVLHCSFPVTRTIEPNIFKCSVRNNLCLDLKPLDLWHLKMYSDNWEIYLFETENVAIFWPVGFRQINMFHNFNRSFQKELIQPNKLCYKTMCQWFEMYVNIQIHSA